MEMHHGHYLPATTIHPGMCLTDDEYIAYAYATAGAYEPVGHITTIEIDDTDLDIVEIDTDYDVDANWAPGDDDLTGYDADIIIFTDATESGRTHRTWRLVTGRAVAACRIVTTIACADLEDA